MAKEITVDQLAILKTLGLSEAQIEKVSPEQLNIATAGLFVQAPGTVQKDTLSTLEKEVDKYKKEVATKLAGKLLAAFQTASDSFQATFVDMFKVRPTLAKNKSDSKTFPIISTPIKIDDVKYTYRVSVSIAPILEKENQGQDDPKDDPKDQDQENK